MSAHLLATISTLNMYLMKMNSNQEHLQNGQCSAVRQEEFILPTDKPTDIYR